MESKLEDIVNYPPLLHQSDYTLNAAKQNKELQGRPPH